MGVIGFSTRSLLDVLPAALLLTWLLIALRSGRLKTPRLSPERTSAFRTESTVFLTVGLVVVCLGAFYAGSNPIVRALPLTVAGIALFLIMRAVRKQALAAGLQPEARLGPQHIGLFVGLALSLVLSLALLFHLI